jgi:hypothetical protein
MTSRGVHAGKRGMRGQTCTDRVFVNQSSTL